MTLRRAALLGLLVILGAATLGRPDSVAAHAFLLRADPPDLCNALSSPQPPPGDARCRVGAVLGTPPAAVQLWFTESIEPFAGGIAVIGPDGSHAEHGAARAHGSQMGVDVDVTAPGTYEVRWSVIASDTHPERGSFPFSVGTPSVGAVSTVSGAGGSVSALGLGLQAAGRWLHLLGEALGFGGLAFGLLVLRPGVETRRDRAAARVWRLAGLGVLLLLLAEALALPAEVVSASGARAFDPELLGTALGSSFGRVLAQRLAAALLLWVLAGVARQGQRWAGLVALGVGAALAVADGQASHATQSGPAVLGLLLNGLHVGAMALWLGGVVALSAVWRLPEMADVRREVLFRFGKIAGACVALAIASGVAMAWLRLARPENLLGSGYDRVLLLKGGLFVLVIALVALGLRAGLSMRARWWQREATALALLLGCAALLVSMPPPR